MQNNKNLTIEHINFIIQKLRFTLSLNTSTRPQSAVRKSAKKVQKYNLSKANIHFDEFTVKDSVFDGISEKDISNELQD